MMNLDFQNILELEIRTQDGYKGALRAQLSDMNETIDVCITFVSVDYIICASLNFQEYI